MKLSQTLIFLTIVFALYGAINFYIIRHALSVVPESYKTLFLTISIFVVISFFAGRLIENFGVSFISDLFIWIGSFWIAFMFYFFICLVLIDFARLINLIIPLPSFPYNQSGKDKAYNRYSYDHSCCNYSYWRIYQHKNAGNKNI